MRDRNRRYVIAVFLLMICAVMCSCGNKAANNDKDMISFRAQKETEEQNNIIDTCNRIFLSVSAEENGQLPVQSIVEQLGLCGYTTIDSENLLNMTHPEALEAFALDGENTKQSTMICVSDFGEFSVYTFERVSDEVFVKKELYRYADEVITKVEECQFEASFLELTEDGYFILSGSYSSPEQYVLTLSDEEVHLGFRVRPLDEKCRELGRKYIMPIAYSLNNVFLTDWNCEEYRTLDFYDLFVLFYKECFGREFPYVRNEDLSIGNEYWIPADEFERVISLHFDMEADELKLLLCYDKEKNAYRFRPRGFGELDYVELPTPEVVSYVENADGSITLTVNAVYPNANTSRLFSSEITIKEQNGRVYYLSNHVIEKNEQDMWWHAERFTDEEWKEHYSIRNAIFAKEDDISWMFPAVEKELFTESEKIEIESKVLDTCQRIWSLYDGALIDESAPSYVSGIIDFSDDMRRKICNALGASGVAAVTEDVNMINGKLLESFYQSYEEGKEDALTLYEVERDGFLSTYTFLYREGRIQIYYLGVKSDGEKPVIAVKTWKDVSSMRLTEKGYFFYEDAAPVLHASSSYFYRVSPLSEECRRLTRNYLAHIDLQKYNLLVTDWNRDTVSKILMPGVFEDFYYIKYGENYDAVGDDIPGDLFEEIMLSYLPASVAQLREAYSYDEKNNTYAQETKYSSPYSPFLEVVAFKKNVDGTITLYADGVWPDYDADEAFTDVITVEPHKDGTFRILSNDVEEKERKLPLIAYE